MNQIGTISETLAVVERAKRGRLPHRHLGALRRDGGRRRSPTSRSARAGGQIKVGSVAQSERLAKYNQLLRIEEALGADAPYAGRAALAL